MKNIICLFCLLAFLGCKKSDDTADKNAIAYRSINLKVPLNTAFVYTFEIDKYGLKTDITFSFQKVGNTFTAQYMEYYGAFRCYGVNNYTYRASIDELINPPAIGTEAFKFLEATVNSGTVSYGNTNNIKLDEEAYVPFYTYMNGVKAGPSFGWIRIKCTQTELFIYDLAFRETGSIKAGEK